LFPAAALVHRQLLVSPEVEEGREMQPAQWATSS